MIGDIENGGLNVPDIFAIYKAQRIRWLSRYHNQEISHPWKWFVKDKLKKIGDTDVLLKCNFDIQLLPLKLCKSHHSLLQSWLTVANNSDLHYLNQYIWNNQNIKIAGKSVFYKEFLDAGLIYVGQLFSKNGNLLKWHEVVVKYELPQYAMLK